MTTTQISTIKLGLKDRKHISVAFPSLTNATTAATDHSNLRQVFIEHWTIISPQSLNNLFRT